MMGVRSLRASSDSSVRATLPTRARRIVNDGRRKRSRRAHGHEAWEAETATDGQSEYEL